MICSDMGIVSHNSLKSANYIYVSVKKTVYVTLFNSHLSVYSVNLNMYIEGVFASMIRLFVLTSFNSLPLPAFSYSLQAHPLLSFSSFNLFQPATCPESTCQTEPTSIARTSVGYSAL